MKLTPAEKSVIGTAVVVGAATWIALLVMYAATLRAWGVI